MLAIAPAAFGQPQSSGPQERTSLRLSWEGTPGVLRYRLQVSLDAQFTDLVFDRAVFGREYVVNGLPVGKYYWRVAPAAEETGTFSKPRIVDIPGGAKTISSTDNQATGDKPLIRWPSTCATRPRPMWSASIPRGWFTALMPLMAWRSGRLVSGRTPNAASRRATWSAKRAGGFRGRSESH
jgi:hypothetical protein